MKRARLAAVTLCAGLACAGARAQWTTAPPESDASPRNDATVRNAEGAELRIWMDRDARVLAVFRLPKGLVALDPAGCPTFQIDDRPPEDLSPPAHPCSADGDRAQVVLARASAGQLESATLLALMNGGNLTVRYRLAHAGYGATTFSLKGSKQVLTSTLGEGVNVVGD